MRMPTAVLTALALVALPTPLRGQSILDLLQSIRAGGGWVYIDIANGRGTWVSRPLPTLELTLKGCMQVYAGHSGRWDLRARDALGDGHLQATVAGGEPVPFRYRTGARSQLDVEVRWSERRDTTLAVWVGLESLGKTRDPCAPIYGTGEDGEGAGGAVPAPAEPRR
jgi:hypothetical protein